MKNKTLSILKTFLGTLILSAPVLLFAQWSPGQPIVNCTNDCNWLKLVELVNRVISFLLYLATILAIFAFIYAGFQMMTAGGNESKVTEAKTLFFKVVVGLIFAYGAWILVYFILSALGVPSEFNLLT